MDSVFIIQTITTLLLLAEVHKNIFAAILPLTKMSYLSYMFISNCKMINWLLELSKIQSFFFYMLLFQMKLSFTLDKEMMMPQGCYVYQYRDSNK